MTDALTHADIKNLLRAFRAAIELDQLRVDAIPAADLHPMYQDAMWREWRADHVSYINNLLSTVDKIPSAVLSKLTKFAFAYDPYVIGRVALELFAEVVSGSVPKEELGTAERFFRWLMVEVGRRSKSRPRSAMAKSLISKWLNFSDPLRISRDPECQYVL